CALPICPLYSPASVVAALRMYSPVSGTTVIANVLTIAPEGSVAVTGMKGLMGTSHIHCSVVVGTNHSRVESRRTSHSHKKTPGGSLPRGFSLSLPEWRTTQATGFQEAGAS